MEEWHDDAMSGIRFTLPWTAFFAADMHPALPSSNALARSKTFLPASAA